jgi:hypothetical protein
VQLDLHRGGDRGRKGHVAGCLVNDVHHALVSNLVPPAGSPAGPGTLPDWLAPTGGFAAIPTIEHVLASVRAQQGQAATLQQLGSTLCEAVGSSEAAPPPVGLTHYTGAMNNLAQASLLLHGPSTVSQNAANPYLNTGSIALAAFREDIGRPL